MLKFHIEQFGCRATQADGAAIERQLLERGCASAPDAHAADVVVVNTCTVTAAADSQARDAIRKIHAKNPSARVIVTGCYAQRAPEELAALPGVAWVVGNSHKAEIPSLVEKLPPELHAHAGGDFVFAEDLHLSPRSEGVSYASRDSFSIERAPANILNGNIFEQTWLPTASIMGSEGSHTRPILKIQDGCDSRCSYCVIPFVRGKSRSLAADTVVSEMQRLCAFGHREIVLSGINLGAYGRDLSPRVEFIDLVRRILDQTSIERLRISSIEPMDVTHDLISLFACTERMAQHFHVPLQSGSDRILAAMHRWYRAEHYARRVELIREDLPHAAIGADVIAGFPDETEDDHAATFEFIERLPFTYLHVFSFSERPGTRAATLPNRVPAHVVKRRARELRGLGEAKAAAFRAAQIGRTLRVLTLRDDRDSLDASTPALSSNYLRMRVAGKLAPNQWVDFTLPPEGENAFRNA